MESSKKILLTTIGIAILIVTLAGVTYSFFNYTRTGSSNVIKVGRINFVSRQTNSINLTNLFPIDPTDNQSMNDSTKVGTITIEIEGDADYGDGIEYVIETVNSNLTTNGKTLPISLDITVTTLGTESANYFTARNSKNATIYKKLVGETLEGDQQILVGYIKPNTTSGTAEGVDGSITIKAYLDENKILVSDTYNNGEAPTDNLGTPASMGEGKTVFTTSEWNALQNSGVSFQVKVEANEGIWVRDPNTLGDDALYNIMNSSSIMDNISSDYVSASTGVNFNYSNSDTNGKGLYMRAGTENDTYPIVYYRGSVTNNNVYFGGFCWKIVRTTNTGGIKLLYNGVNTGTENNPACASTGNATTIGVHQYSYSNNEVLYRSSAYAGYMYGNNAYEYEVDNSYDDDMIFGSGFTYSNGEYHLTGTGTGIATGRHYSCASTSEDTCNELRYYLNHSYDNYYYYVLLVSGESIEEAWDAMNSNDVDSNIKTVIDNWYANNMTSYTNKLEDTVWCNDRSVDDLNGWDPTGTLDGNFEYNSYARAPGSFQRNGLPPSLACSANDSFTVDSANGNGALTYPVGMLTNDEVRLAGLSRLDENDANYVLNGVDYWTMTPEMFDYNGGDYDLPYPVYVSVITVADRGFISGEQFTSYSYDYLNIYVRPSISLKHNSVVSSGTGTTSDPYIVR